MGLSSRSGKAVTDLNNPVAFGVSDRGGAWYNHDKLHFQHQWAGNQLVNLQILVGEDELDVPQEQLRSIVLPPDPIPTENPRLEPFAMDAVGGNYSGQGVYNGASGGNPITNWDQAGGKWDMQGGQWNLEEVPD